jgi:phosphoribosylformylglycinamidine synthase I
MKTAVVLFPGSNRDKDMLDALAYSTGEQPQKVWHTETDLPACDLIVIPGGFSFGDYLRCGAIAARSPIMRDVIAKANNGVAVFGVCNGFQILIEAGLLPGALMRNASLNFICKETCLEVTSTQSLFTSQFAAGEIIRCPVAHGDGNYTVTEDQLKMLQDEDRIAFRYAEGYNANGSTDSIAGILNSKRNVLGMMPHPENYVLPHQSSQDGARLFRNMIESLHKAPANA